MPVGGDGALGDLRRHAWVWWGLSVLLGGATTWLLAHDWYLLLIVTIPWILLGPGTALVSSDKKPKTARAKIAAITAVVLLWALGVVAYRAMRP